jgi:hypothetical protein
MMRITGSLIRRLADGFAAAGMRIGFTMKGLAMGDKEWLDRQFVRDMRLGIALPSLETDWDEMSRTQQEAVLARWEEVRGTIPERIIRLEDTIRTKQDRLYEEEDFAVSCRLNAEIAELASRIHDLHIWFRVQQDLDEETRRHS